MKNTLFTFVRKNKLVTVVLFIWLCILIILATLFVLKLQTPDQSSPATTYPEGYVPPQDLTPEKIKLITSQLDYSATPVKVDSAQIKKIMSQTDKKAVPVIVPPQLINNN